MPDPVSLSDRLILAILSALAPEKVARACGVPEAEIGVELAAVREHLVPLNLAPSDTSTQELARLAVSEIVSLKHAGTRRPPIGPDVPGGPYVAPAPARLPRPAPAPDGFHTYPRCSAM